MSYPIMLVANMKLHFTSTIFMVDSMHLFSFHSVQRQPAAPQRQLESHKGATVSKLFKQRNLDDIQRVRYRPIGMQV